MTTNKDLRSFLGHNEWYTHVKGIGYVPTPTAPPHIAESIRRWNEKQKQMEKEMEINDENYD